MLPADQRLTAPADFRAVVRRGSRGAAPTMVVHLLVDTAAGATSDAPDRGTAPIVPSVARAGLVVAKAVGPAVTRNRVKRRLRHLLREQLADLPSASRVVVRARPEAALADYGQLREALRRSLGTALDRAAR